MKKTILVFLFLISLPALFAINKLNYQKQREIKNSVIKHPENLPTKKTAKNTSFGFQNLKADLYWLETIQYIGSNAIESHYKQYLYAILDLITELNPYFEHPYIIGQLLLPNYNQRYEKLTKTQQELYIKQGEELGLKGMKNFCDPKKIKRIETESNLNTIWTNKAYQNPCASYTIPYYLAYIYHFYKKDPLNASKYYKIASANDDSLEGAKIMVAIMQGRGGNREKSYFMFLNIAKFVDANNESCNNFANILENIGVMVFLKKNIPLNEQLIKEIESQREKIIGTFNEESEKAILSDTQCPNYVNKATRELSLAYIEQANNKYKKEHEGESSNHAKELYDEGYLEYLPTDYQQYEDYGIIYVYNKDTGNYDYEMGTYSEYDY